MRPLVKSSDKKTNGKSEIQKAMIIEYLTDHVDGSAAELSMLLDVKTSRTKKLIYELVHENIIVRTGSNRNRRYKLKS